MKKSRFSEEQIIGILKQHESGVKTADLCRELVSTASPMGDIAGTVPTCFQLHLRPTSRIT